MKEKFQLILKNRGAWLGLGTIVGAFLGDKAAAVVSVLSTFFVI
jgi:hypothetical protein